MPCGPGFDSRRLHRTPLGFGRFVIGAANVARMLRGAVWKSRVMASGEVVPRAPRMRIASRQSWGLAPPIRLPGTRSG
jgi:hypothetical protein